MHSPALIEKVRALRAKGNTYSEISDAIETVVPKSTIVYWCRDVELPHNYKNKIKKINLINFKKMREGFKINRNRRDKEFFKKIDSENSGLIKTYKQNIDVQRLTLSVLYLAEGSKTARGSLMFSNSYPLIVSLFVKLMRRCYKIDESKFRCTVQCRADQDVRQLELFWSKTTKIPLEQFYKARIDSRTVGKVTRKKDYKGVCRIDYFSSAVDLELKHIAKLILAK